MAKAAPHASDHADDQAADGTHRQRQQCETNGQPDIRGMLDPPDRPAVNRRPTIIATAKPNSLSCEIPHSRWQTHGQQYPAEQQSSHSGTDITENSEAQR
jgi:hypothetical protein